MKSWGHGDRVTDTPCHKSCLFSGHSLTSAPLEGTSCSRNSEASFSFQGRRNPSCLPSGSVGLLPRRHGADKRRPNLLSDLLGKAQMPLCSERRRSESYNSLRVKSWGAATGQPFVVPRRRVPEGRAMYTHQSDTHASSPAIRV